MKHGSDTFETLHAGLAVELIQTSRESLVTCGPLEKAVEVLQRNECGHETYDYLPVEDEGEITGLFRTRTIAADPPEEGIAVQSLMDGLSSANLIGGDGAILDFLREVDEKPYRLVVAGNRVSGLVTWSDLQKLPVRAVLFGLITGLEMEMARAIRRRYPSRNDWLQHLEAGARQKVERLITRGGENDSEVDSLLYTHFGDKMKILREMDCPGCWAESRREEHFEEIRDLRNAVAHARDYVTSREEVTKIQGVIRSLLRIRLELRKWQAIGSP